MLVEHYVEAANHHDVEAVRELTSEDAIWYLGPYTLTGRDQVMQPLKFDQGANTILIAKNIIVKGDTVDFDLEEKNDVLKVYGITQLHHFPRFIFRDGLIYRIIVRRPPLEQKEFS